MNWLDTISVWILLLVIYVVFVIYSSRSRKYEDNKAYSEKNLG